MWWGVLLLLIPTASAAPLGPVLRQDGFQLRPPATFRMGRMELFHGTQVGAIAVDPKVSRYLSAALFDGVDEDAASLMLTVVEGPFALGQASRDQLATATVRHFRDSLGQPFQLERAEVVNGRVEVLGSVRQGSQLRRILVAVWPHSPRHVVAVSSVPSGRWEALSPALHESLDSLKLDASTGFRPPQGLLWVTVAVLGLLLLLSMKLRRATRDGV